MGLVRNQLEGEGMHFRGPETHMDIVIDEIRIEDYGIKSVILSEYHLDQKTKRRQFELSPYNFEEKLQNDIVIGLTPHGHSGPSKASMYYSAPEFIRMERCEGDNKPIRFYRPESRYGFFSNFSAHELTFGKYTWPTAEHFFQAQKFSTTNPDHALKMREAKTPELVFAMGRNKRKRMRKDWDIVKDRVMKVAVGSKFLQHQDLAELLANTGYSPIIEAAEHDTYWGEGSNGNGKNKLGLTLMEVREALYDDNLEQIISHEAQNVTLLS